MANGLAVDAAYRRGSALEKRRRALPAGWASRRQPRRALTSSSDSGAGAASSDELAIDAANTIDVPSGAPLGAENGKGPAAETADGAQTPSPAALPAATERGGPPSIEDRRRESLLSRAKSLLYAAEIPLIRFAAQKRKSRAGGGRRGTDERPEDGGLRIAPVLVSTGAGRTVFRSTAFIARVIAGWRAKAEERPPKTRLGLPDRLDGRLQFEADAGLARVSLRAGGRRLFPRRRPLFPSMSGYPSELGACGALMASRHR